MNRKKFFAVECGHCHFVARSAKAMEEHFKEHQSKEPNTPPHVIIKTEPQDSLVDSFESTDFQLSDLPKDSEENQMEEMELEISNPRTVFIKSEPPDTWEGDMVVDQPPHTLWSQPDSILEDENCGFESVSHSAVFDPLNMYCKEEDGDKNESVVDEDYTQTLMSEHLSDQFLKQEPNEESDSDGDVDVMDMNDSVQLHVKEESHADLELDRDSSETESEDETKQPDQGMCILHDEAMAIVTKKIDNTPLCSYDIFITENDKWIKVQKKLQAIEDVKDKKFVECDDLRCKIGEKYHQGSLFVDKQKKFSYVGLTHMPYIGDKLKSHVLQTLEESIRFQQEMKKKALEERSLQSGELSFKCTVDNCDVVCYDRPLYVGHVMVYHKGAPLFYCPYCSYVSTDRENTNRHRETIHGKSGTGKRMTNHGTTSTTHQSETKDGILQYGAARRHKQVPRNKLPVVNVGLKRQAVTIKSQAEATSCTQVAEETLPSVYSKISVNYKFMGMKRSVRTIMAVLFQLFPNCRRSCYAVLSRLYTAVNSETTRAILLLKGKLEDTNGSSNDVKQLGDTTDSSNDVEQLGDINDSSTDEQLRDTNESSNDVQQLGDSNDSSNDVKPFGSKSDTSEAEHKSASYLHLTDAFPDADKLHSYAVKMTPKQVAGHSNCSNESDDFTVMVQGHYSRSEITALEEDCFVMGLQNMNGLITVLKPMRSKVTGAFTFLCYCGLDVHPSNSTSSTVAGSSDGTTELSTGSQYDSYSCTMSCDTTDHLTDVSQNARSVLDIKPNLVDINSETLSMEGGWENLPIEIKQEPVLDTIADEFDSHMCYNHYGYSNHGNSDSDDTWSSPECEQANSPKRRKIGKVGKVEKKEGKTLIKKVHIKLSNREGLRERNFVHPGECKKCFGCKVAKKKRIKRLPTHDNFRTGRRTYRKRKRSPENDAKLKMRPVVMLHDFMKVISS